MRGTIKVTIVLLTLLVIGFNVLQCAGIGKAVGSAASATDEKAMQVRGLREQLEKIVKDRNLVRQFEPAAARPARPRSGEESGNSGPQGGSGGGSGDPESTTLSGGSGGRMVWATTEGVVDAEATAVSDKLDREQLVAAGAVVGTGVATVAGGLFSGGLLCVSVGIYIPVVLVLLLILMLTRGSGGRAARAAAGAAGGHAHDQSRGGGRIPVANAAEDDSGR